MLVDFVLGTTGAKLFQAGRGHALVPEETSLDCRQRRPKMWRRPTQNRCPLHRRKPPVTSSHRHKTAVNRNVCRHSSTLSLRLIRRRNLPPPPHHPKDEMFGSHACPPFSAVSPRSRDARKGAGGARGVWPKPVARWQAK